MEKINAAIFKFAQIVASFLDRVVNRNALRLGGDEFHDDPYTEYDRLLTQAPLVRSFAMGGWVVLGFDAVTDALKDSRFSSDARNSPGVSSASRMWAGDGEPTILDYGTLLNTDPPDHTRLRKLARAGFLHKYVQSLAPRIQTLVDDCLSNVRGRQEFDLIETLARPLPANLIAEILGVEEIERDGFRRLSEVYMRNSMVQTFSAQRIAIDTYRQLLEFMDKVVQRKRSEPGADLISQLKKMASSYQPGKSQQPVSC
jgi:cytochrome P450